MFLFCEFFLDEFCSSCPNHWFYCGASSENGEMGATMFLSWFVDAFLKSIPSSRPVLLILQGLVEHVSIELVKVTTKNQVVKHNLWFYMYVKELNSMHFLKLKSFQVVLLGVPRVSNCRIQLLDVGFVEPLHTKALQLRKSRVHRMLVPLFLEQVFNDLNLGSLAKKSFRNSGVCPFNSSLPREVFQAPSESPWNTILTPLRVVQKKSKLMKQSYRTCCVFTSGCFWSDENFQKRPSCSCTNMFNLNVCVLAIFTTL